MVVNLFYYTLLSVCSYFFVASAWINFDAVWTISVHAAWLIFFSTIASTVVGLGDDNNAALIPVKIGLIYCCVKSIYIMACSAFKMLDTIVLGVIGCLIFSFKNIFENNML